MRFLADECCDIGVVRALAAAGHDIASVADLCPGSTDDAVIALALRESRILITEDKDFGQLVAASSLVSPGVMLLRFPHEARNGMIDQVVALVATHGAQLVAHFAVIEPGRVRISRR